MGNPESCMSALMGLSPRDKILKPAPEGIDYSALRRVWQLARLSQKKHGLGPLAFKISRIWYRRRAR
jgi:hypothetical protein